jgi:photosystem II stability/assembly factor-like uncharacterized protein
VGKPDEFDPRLKAYLHRGASTPAPAGLEARINAGTRRQRSGWLLQVAAAAALLVIAIGLGIALQRARHSAGVTPSASPITKPTPYPTPTASGAAYPLLPPASMQMIDRNTGWAAGSGTNRILRTTDGGSHWNDVGPAPSAVKAGSWITFFLDGNHAWLASWLHPGSTSPDFSVAISRTVDGGKTWDEAVDSPVAAEQRWPASMQFIDPAHGWLFMNLGFAAGSQGIAVYGTVDGGITWSKLSEADTSGLQGHLPLRCSKGLPVFLNSSTGWMPGTCGAGGGPFFFVTRDGGRTWNDVGITPPAGYDRSCMCGISSFRLSDPRFCATRSGFFVLDIYGADGAQHDFVYTTTDGGSSWWPGPMLPANCFTADFIAPAYGWTLDAKKNTILQTGDGGQHWSTLGIIPSSQGVVDFHFVNSAIGWPWAASLRATR